MDKTGLHRLIFEFTPPTIIITCLKYVQNNKIKRLTSKSLLMYFNSIDSYVLVSCLWVFQNMELCCW